MIEFNIFHDEIVKFYPYRTARTSNWFVKVHMDEKAIRRLASILEDFGFSMDNHIVFCTDVCCFWYSDNWLRIGGKVVEGSY